MDIKCKISRCPSIWETAVHLAVAGGDFDGVFVCCPFSQQMSWMRSGT